VDPAAVVTTGRSLVAVRDWTFLLGPGLMPAVNALCLGSLLYRSGLVPRIIPAIGLAGAPLARSCRFAGPPSPAHAWPEGPAAARARH
jgi:hypothetical protein